MRIRSRSYGQQFSRRHFLSHASISATFASSLSTSLGADRFANAAEMPDMMKDALGEHVQSGFVPGFVAGVWRQSKLKIEVIGAQSFGGAPMRVNSIFRLASITKPVVAAAAMILVDDGILQLDEPVEALLP
jgi:CubicO group peptidase (beta-lactamase class C family)